MSFILSQKHKLLFLFIFLGLIKINCLSWAQTKPNQPSTTDAETQPNDSSNTPKLPARGAPVGRRRGGTSRNNCPPIKPSLTAVVPGEETTTGLAQSNSYLAHTVSENPTFWLYIPNLPKQLRTGEFILQTEAGEDIKRSQIKLPSTEGLIAITLPANSQPSLAIGEKYHWYFKIYCEESIPESEYYFVDAWIERIPVSPELENQLQTGNRVDYLVYRERHIWYDALTNLGQRLQNNPSDQRLRTDWIDLLKSVGLASLGNSPIIEINRQYLQ